MSLRPRKWQVQDRSCKKAYCEATYSLDWILSVFLPQVLMEASLFPL